MLIKHAAIALAALLFAQVAIAQTAPPSRIRGEIAANDGKTLMMHRPSGEMVEIALAPDTPVSGVKKLALSDIKNGSFVGIATHPSTDGKLVAIEVLVFPEAARGSNEGHYGWDLVQGGMMTNANVDTVVETQKGRDLTLSYKGGTKQISVPENVPIVTFQPANAGDLTVGKKAFVVAGKEGEKYKALRIIVEKDGVAPPM